MLWLVILLSPALAVLEECQAALAAMASGLSDLSSDYAQMINYSGHYVNELGRYVQCNRLDQDIARYVIIELYRAPTILFALCGPAVCEASDYLSLLHSLPVSSPLHTLLAISTEDNPIDVKKAKVHFPYEYTKDHETLSAGGGMMVAILVILTGICLIGTFLEALNGPLGEVSQGIADKKRFIAESFANVPHEEANRVSRFLQCFSLYSNFISLFRPSRHDSRLGCLCAVRVLSICWLLLGHTADMRLLRGVLKNVSDLPDIIADWKTTPITAAGYSIDTLLWASGFVTTYTLLSDLKDVADLKWAELYLYKLWRVLPLLLFLLFLTWGLFPFFGWGPVWFSYNDFCDECESDWWTNLLFINNFFKSSPYTSCYLTSYYISLEIQFFLITPPIVYAYRRWGAGFAWLSTAFLMAVGLISSFEIANSYDLNAQEISQGNSDYDYYYYYRPYTRIPAYAVGLFCALVVYGYDHKDADRPDRAASLVGKVLGKQPWAFLSLLSGAGIVTFCVFIQHTALKQGGPDFTYWSAAQNQSFITFNRWLFTIGVSLIVMPMTLGSLTWLYRAFSWHVWTPLSRLTYSTYLVSYNLALVLFLSQQYSWYFNFLRVIQDLLCLLFLSYLSALFISLLVELPCVTLAKTFVLSRHPLK